MAEEPWTTHKRLRRRYRWHLVCKWTITIVLIVELVLAVMRAEVFYFGCALIVMVALLMVDRATRLVEGDLRSYEDTHPELNR
jgi:cytochrome c-type biogenesis protein CcmE